MQSVATKDEEEGPLCCLAETVARRVRHIEHMADVKETTRSSRSPAEPSVRAKSGFMCVRPGLRNQVPSLCGPKCSFKQDQPSPTSLRQLQAKMEAENQTVQELLQPLLSRENGLMKELESFLTQTDVAKLRRRELLHKHWSENVWFPLQKRATLRHYNSKCLH